MFFLHILSKFGGSRFERLMSYREHNFVISTQIQTDADNDNTRRPKLALGKNVTIWKRVILN